MAALAPKLLAGYHTDPGLVPEKQENEDCAAYRETPLGHLFVLCDGMGGHHAGREASHLAVQTIFDEVQKAHDTGDKRDRGLVLADAMGEAGRRVFGLGGAPGIAGRPGSTAVALLVHDGGTEVAHIGDSRAYVVRGGQIWPLTRDHSVVQQLVDAGMLKREEMAAHPESNKILRALGLSDTPEIELRPDIVHQAKGDVFVLTSDGITDVVQDTDLLGLVTASGGDMTALCLRSVELANARGGPDNATIIAYRVDDPGLREGASTVRGFTEEDTRDSMLPGAPPPKVQKGGGYTLKMQVYTAPPPPPPVGAAAAQGSATATPPPVPRDAPAPTIPDEAPPSSAVVHPPKRPVALGVALFAVGLLVAIGSVVALFASHDEAPAPMLETPPASSSK